jgi:pimeloyl-ACP methyl ester carboxylesterase
MDTHPLRRLESEGRHLSYLTGGSGQCAILILTAAHGVPLLLYDTVLRLEDTHRVVVLDVGEAASLDELARDVGCVLDAEGLDRVVAFGQSLCGILAQAFLMRGASRLEALVISQTIAPRHESNRMAVLWILRLLPGALLRVLMKKKLGRLSTVDLPEECAARHAMSRALLRLTAATTLSKKRIMNIARLIFEFNREESYGVAANGAWPGRVLVFTSEDDLSFGYVGRIEKALPRTEVYVLAKGAGHLAPLAHSREYFDRIEHFLHSL